MPKENSIVIDIGGEVSKTWKDARDTVRADLNTFNKLISQNAQRINRASKAQDKYTKATTTQQQILKEGNATTRRYSNTLDNYNKKVANASNILINGNSVTRRYTNSIDANTAKLEKQQQIIDNGNAKTRKWSNAIQKLSADNTNLEASIEASKEKIIEFNQQLEDEKGLLRGMTKGETPWKAFENPIRLQEIALGFQAINAEASAAGATIERIQKYIAQLQDLKAGKGDVASMLSDKDKRKILLKAKPEDFTNAKEIAGYERELNALKQIEQGTANQIEETTKQYKTLTNTLEQAKQKLAGFAKGQKGINAARSAVTDAEQAIQAADNKLTSLNTKLEETISKIAAVEAQLKTARSFENLKQDDPKIYNKALDNIDKEISRAEKELDKASGKKATAIDKDNIQVQRLNLQLLRENIRAEKEYANAVLQREQSINKISKSIEDENIKIEKNTHKIEDNNTKIAITQQQWDEYRLQIAATIEQLKTRVAEAEAKLEEYKNKTRDTLDYNAAKAQETSQKQSEYLDKTNEKLDETKEKLKETQSVMSEEAREIAANFRVAFANTIANSLNGVIGLLRTLAKTAVKAVRNLTGVFAKTTAQALGLKDAIRLIVQYGFGFRSLYYLIRRLRSAIKQGFEYLGGIQKSAKTAYSGASKEVNKLIRSLKELMAYLKSAAAAMLQPFMPLINTILPRLVSWFDRVTTSVARFIATLTGQKYIYRASTNMEDYANALDSVSGSAKEAKKQLAAFDDINVLDDNKSGSGSSGSTLDTSGWFNIEELIPSNFAEMLKNAWGSGNFTSIGVFLGEQISEILESIDWDKIFSKTRKIATAIRTTIRGIITSPNLGKDIGEAIANLFNTISIYIYTNVTDESFWKRLGQFFGDAFNTLFKKIDASTFGKGIHNLVAGILTAISKFLERADGSSVGIALGNFLAGLDLGDLVNKLWNVAKQIVNALGDAINGWAKKDPNSFGFARAIVTSLIAAKSISVLAKGFVTMTNLVIKSGQLAKAAKKLAEAGINTATAKTLEHLATTIPTLLTKVGSLLLKALPVIGISALVLAVVGGIVHGIKQHRQDVVDAIKSTFPTSSEYGEIKADLQSHFDETVDNALANIGVLEKYKDGLIACFDANGKLQEGTDATANVYLKELANAGIISYDSVEDLTKAFNDGKLSVDEINKAFETYRENLLQNAYIEAYKDKLQSLVQSQIDLQNEEKTHTELLGTKEDIYNTLMSTAEEYFKYTYETAGRFGSVASLTDEQLKTGIENTKKQIQEAYDADSETFMRFVNARKDAIPELKELYNSLNKDTINSLEGMDTAWDTHVKTVQQNEQDINEVMTNIQTLTRTTTDNITNNIDTTTEIVGDKIENSADNISKDAHVAAGNISENYENSFSTIADNTKELGETMVSNTQTAVSESTKAIGTGMSSMLQTYNSYATELAKSHNNLMQVLGSTKEMTFNPALGGQLYVPEFVGITLQSGKFKSANLTPPHLAQGAVIPPNREFLAVLGDQTSGTNIEAPLDTIISAMQQALGSMNLIGAGGQDIILNIDGKAFARATLPNTLKELNRKGYNVKVLEKK